MKKLISLIIFVGLAINVSAQDQPTNREEAMAKVSWLIGDWERTSSNGEKQQSSYKWAIENIAILITTGGRMQSSGVLGFDRTNGKLVGKSFNRIGTADSEWSFSDGKLIEKITLKEKEINIIFGTHALFQKKTKFFSSEFFINFFKFLIVCLSLQ